MRKKQLINKKLYKKVNNTCRICGIEQYEVLDVHRIIPGEQGGKYVKGNVVSICSNCHRNVHNGLIEIKGWIKSTGGDLLHIIKERKEILI